MKKLFLFTTLLAVAALSFPLVSQAEDNYEMPDTYFYLGANLGQYYYDFNSHENNYGMTQTTLPGVDLGWRFKRHWSVQLSWERNEYSWKTKNHFRHKNGYMNVPLISGRYHFASTSWAGFEPYLGVTSGEQQLKARHSDTYHRQTLLGPEFGAQTMLLPYLSLDLGARPLWRMDSNSWDGEIYAALNFIFQTGKTQKTDTTDNTEPAPVYVNDSDGDGVPDSADQCPNTPTGVQVDAKGCSLDSDNDGVPDNVDQCPGTAANAEVDAKGCPLDSDNDGVPDYRDQCPGTLPGALVDEKGCQKSLTRDIHQTLYVQFATGKAVVKPASYDDIGDIAKQAAKYPSSRIELDGYTDNTGSAAINKRLSKERAQAVKKVLVERFGVDAARISTAGRGPANPVASNKTAEGRAKNRRVEVIFKAQKTEAQFKN